MTAVIRQLAPSMREAGFRRFGTTFNRETEPGLVQVVSFQASKWGGRFTVNLGIYVREVDKLFDDWWGRFKTGIPGQDGAVKEEVCWLRDRLGAIRGGGGDLWWDYADLPTAAEDVKTRLATDAADAFAEASTRSGLMRWWEDPSGRVGRWRVERRAPLGFAVILKEAARVDEARAIVETVCRESRGIPFFHTVSVLAEELGFECPEG
jgi:hypothetical protein